MAAKSNERRLVRRDPGPGTAQSIYTDEYGERWTEDPHVFSFGSTTGQRVGYIVGSTITVKTI